MSDYSFERSRDSRSIRTTDPGNPPMDYKDVDQIRKCITGSSKLMSRKRTGMSAQAQNALKNAVKRARFMALIPYTGS